MDQPKLLTPEQAASFLNVSQATLENYRRKAIGPKYHRLGHRTIRYLQSDLEAWLEKLASPTLTTAASN